MWAAGEPPVENFGGMNIAEGGASEDGSAIPQQMHQQQQQMPQQHQMHQQQQQQMQQQYQQDPGGYGQQQPDGSCSYAGGAYGHAGGDMGYGDPSGGWGMGMGMGMGMGEQDDDYGDGHPMPQSMIEGPSVLIPALSFRQPFASLVLYGIKQLEARNRPTLKQMQGPLALHVSHREEPWNSPLLSAAVSLLRRRYPDEQINQFFQLPQTMAQVRAKPYSNPNPSPNPNPNPNPDPNQARAPCLFSPASRCYSSTRSVVVLAIVNLAIVVIAIVSIAPASRCYSSTRRATVECHSGV